MPRRIAYRDNCLFNALLNTAGESSHREKNRIAAATEIRLDPIGATRGDEKEEIFPVPFLLQQGLYWRIISLFLRIQH